MPLLRADEIFASLDRHRVLYVVVGGLAALLHGSPLPTVQGMNIGELVVQVAALEDVIRSKEAANRAKDQRSLPVLRLLLDEIRKRDRRS